MAADKTIVESVIDGTGLAADRIVSLFAGLLAAFLILYSGYVLYDNIYTQAQAYSSSWDIMKYRPDIIDNDKAPLTASELASINADYRFWLTVYNTSIDYPVMQANDDLYYASHDIMKKTSLTGSLYLAAANSPDLSDNYNIVYGHHMDAQALFGGLDAYHDAGYLSSHKPGIVVLPDAVYDFEIFAVMDTTSYDEMVYAPGNRDLASLIDYIRSHSSIFDEAAVANADKILALSTCEDALTNGRLVVFASLHKRNIPPDQIQILTGDDNTGNDNNTDASNDTTSSEPNDIIPAILNPDNNPLLAMFYPSGSSYTAAWALVNLICLILTIFLVLPIGFLKAKFSRASLMDDVNEEKKALWDKMEQGGCTPEEVDNFQWIHEWALETIQEDNPEAVASDVTREDFEVAVEELYYEEGKFHRRFRPGLIIEIVLAICALIFFILTEDMRLPMILIDVWTPFQFLLLVAVWILDVRLIRYRKNRPEQEQWNEDDDSDSDLSARDTSPIPAV